MATIVKTGWLHDKNGDKFAPKTLTSQVQTSDGVLLEDKLQSDLATAKEDILANVTIDVDSELSATSTNPVQNKVVNAEFDAISDAMGALESAINGKASSIHDHDNDYDAKGAADTALETAKKYTDTKTSGLASTATVENAISTHSTSTSAHNDIRVLIADLTEKLNAFLDVDDATTDQLSEVLTLINNNKGTLESLTTNKINVSDIVNNLTTNSTSKVLSAAQGVMIKGLIDALDAEIDTKANTSHIHIIADITNLQSTLDGKAASGHTHNYAGSSSVGGAATSADKLNTDAGSATQPVYFANGVPKATTYTLGKSVPSDAVFTDTTYSVVSTTADGLVPQLDGNRNHFFRGDGEWSGIPTTIYPTATTSSSGLMSSSDKSKLDSIAYGANNYTHPETHDVSMITGLDNVELITTNDIDTICGGSIVAASEVTF